MRPGNMKPWTLLEAQSLIQALEPMVREGLKAHLLLGGSVLHRGGSHKDLDLFVCPLNGNDEWNEYKAMQWLQEHLGLESFNPLRDSPDYAAGEPWFWQGMYWAEYEGKRIDFFLR